MRKRLLLMMLLLLQMVVSRAATKINGIYYNLDSNNKTAEVTYGSNKYSGSVTIPKSVTYSGVDYSVTSIGWFAFSNCSGLTSVTIPNSVTSIGCSAFSSCSGLTSVTIPSSVTIIEDYAFQNCSGLTSITVDAGNKEYDSRGNCNAIIETASNTLVAGCKNTTIPSSVTSIGDYAFYNCSGLTSVTIPNSVTSIGDYAFYYCSGLTSVTISSNVTSIGSYAFYYCSGLTSVTIPSSVTSIGDHAFYYCSGLTSVTIPSSVTSIGSYAFQGCSCLTSVTIPSSVTNIGIRAFYDCSGLTSVTVPLSVTSIGSDAFYGTAWYNNQPNGLIYTGRVAYKYKGTMSSNTSIVLEEGTLGIAGSAFSNCSGLTSVTIPSGVTSIGDWAFSGCSGLNSITIPSSIKTIGSYTTYGCDALTDIYCLAVELPEASQYAFDKTIGNITLHVPTSALGAYQSTEPWSRFKEVVAIVEEKDYDWSIGAGGDFADINAAMADSRVKAGDVLQVLESNSAIAGEQHVTKAVTIRGNGYGTLNDGWINGALYIDADGVTVKSLYVSDYINLRHENAVIERCRAASIRGVADYDTDNATIRGCFVTGMVSGHSDNPSYGWNIHNNIILGSVAYLSEATFNHNAIVLSSDGLVFLVNPLVYEVSNSAFTNNIVFVPNKQASFSSDVLGSAWQFEYNIHTNSSNPSGYSTNICGYETIGKLFTCSGKAGTEEYYQTAAGSPAKGYANDGGDCGPWSGAFPYKLNGGDDSQGGGGDDPIPGDDWQVEPNDLLALKNIHQALGGSNWTTKKWSFANNGHKTEDFPGVTFTEDGRVTAIDLQDNNLAGECFAIQSPQLSELTTLNLSRNKISGDLGKLVGQLGKLTDLDVSYNRLTKTDGVMAFVEAFASHINVRYQNRAYQTSSPTTAAFTDNVSTMDAQTVTIGRQMNLAVPSLYTYNYKGRTHSINPPFKVYLAGSPTSSMAQLVYNGSSNYTNGYTYKYSGSGLYMLPQGQRVVLVDEWGSYATYSAFPVILHYEEGDADMTGATNVLDVQYTLNFILAPSVTNTFNWSAANTYTDNTINVQDIVKTVNIILGLPRQPNYGSRAESDEAVCDGYVYARQGRIVLTAGKDVSAIDIDLEGVSTDEVALALNRRDFQMIGRNTEWGSRYMIFSPTGQTIPAGTETALLRMSGAGQPVSVACSDPQAQEVFVAVGSAPTGIAEVQGAAESETFYNLSGQRVDSPRKGIYLQRGRKVIVKK